MTVDRITASIGNATPWSHFVCERWRTERVAWTCGFTGAPYVGGESPVVPPTFLSAQYVDAFSLGVPDAPVRLNGANSCRWLECVRVGDHLERRSEIAAAEAKQGRSGLLKIYTIETTYRRAGGGPDVAHLRYQAIRRYPEERGSASARTTGPHVERPAEGPSGQPAPHSGPTHALPADAVLAFETRAESRAVVQYAVATDDLYEGHYDLGYARSHGLPGTIVHGLMKMAWLARAAVDCGGPGSLVREISASYVAMDMVGEPYSVWCAQDDGADRGDRRLRLYGVSGAGVVTTTGSAVVTVDERHGMQ